MPPQEDAPKMRHVERSETESRHLRIIVLRRLPRLVETQDTMFHFLRAENSTCTLVPPLPTKT